MTVLIRFYISKDQQTEKTFVFTNYLLKILYIKKVLF